MTDAFVEVARRPVAYLAVGVHRRGGMERAACEVLTRLARRRSVIVIANDCDCDGIKTERIAIPSRPTIVETGLFRWRARRRARRLDPSTITTGIGASGGPVNVVVAQYCQEAYRQRVGPVRATGRLRAGWHSINLLYFAATERAVYRNPQLKRVIAVSHGVGRELIEFYGVDPAIIRYIPNGVDRSVFHPLADSSARLAMRRKLALPEDGFLACFVGGDWRRKRLQPAIEALASVEGGRLVVVGAGDQREFEQLAQAAGVADRVHFVGKRPDPHRYMQASDVYVFPSLYEAFSLSCIEASACGLPMIVTRINGTDELVEDGVNGFFVDPTADSIAVRLRQLRDDPALRDRLSNAAAAGAARFDWDAIAAQHDAVYDELGRS